MSNHTATHLQVARYIWRTRGTPGLSEQFGSVMMEGMRPALRLPSPFDWQLKPTEDGRYQLTEDRHIRAIYTREELEKDND